MFKNYIRRHAEVGIIIVSLITGIILLSGNVEQAQSNCAGDCFTCHPSIQYTKEHRTLGNCVTCHEPVKTKNKYNLTGKPSGCGDRCFQCHEQWPKDSHHATLDTCLTCHDK